MNRNNKPTLEINKTGPPEKPQYELRLYVIASTPQSMRAIANLRRICDEHLSGRYVLEIIDLAKHPSLAEREQIIAAPTLVKKLPLPLRRLIGDLSQTDRVLLGLDLLRT
ncbi:MAG TPA: circadian clock KaiB family protein [Candidatus Krumholzibacteria bacterium]|nr:circadian clock KaiB family protein [Candidatus Krumholzibacteria bacterium]